MRQRLLLLIVAALIPLVAVIGALSYMSVTHNQEHMKDAAVGFAADILRSVERELRAQSNLIEVLSRSPTLERNPPSLAEFDVVARRFVEEVEAWNRVILSHAERGQLVNTGVPFGTKLPPLVDVESFNRAVREGKTIVTNLTGPGPQAPDGPPRVALRRRVQAGGETVVLTAGVRPAVFADVAKHAQTAPGWRPFLIDGADRIVFSPGVATAGERAGEAAVKARASGNSGVYLGQTRSGEPVITAFLKSPETGWSAHVSIPASEFNAPLRRSAMTIAGLSLLGLVLFAVFVWLTRRELLRMKAEAETASRTTRMEALGRMTGGVAHDFSNLLMVVTTATDMLRKRSGDPGAERFLNAIHSAADRGARLTRELMTFARGQGGEVATIEVGLRLASIKSLLTQSITENISLKFDLPEGQHFVRVDPIQFDLAILNIVGNARDAMPDGGRIVIALERDDYPDRSGRDGYRLSVTDTGSGISPKDLPHVFEPFYTTKEVGKGSGLGLSQVYGFAKANGGLAEIDSLPGEGTTVSIFLPVAEAPAPLVAEKPTHIDESWRADGLEAIVVDDNDDVRVLTGEVLADMGFKVRYASNAGEAMALCEAGADLVVSDIVMPGAMDGVGLARTIRQRWPDMQTILMTGYSEASADAVAAGLRVIGKPFTRAMLLAVISTSRFEGSRRRKRTEV